MSATGVPQINTTLRNVPNGRRLDLMVPSPPTTAFITPYRFRIWQHWKVSTTFNPVLPSAFHLLQETAFNTLLSDVMKR
jgi:hypothetical protein